jgi:hypothetical protein
MSRGKTGSVYPSSRNQGYFELFHGVARPGRRETGFGSMAQIHERRAPRRAYQLFSAKPSISTISTLAPSPAVAINSSSEMKSTSLLNAKATL